MDEKIGTERLEHASDSPEDDTFSRKASLSHSAHHDAKRSTKQMEEIARIDALATGTGVTLASFAHLDEKKILRKMDLRLIPMLALLYLLSFLDRGNIGNAKIEGLTEDLGISGAQYNW